MALVADALATWVIVAGITGALSYSIIRTGLARRWPRSRLIPVVALVLAIWPTAGMLLWRTVLSAVGAVAVGSATSAVAVIGSLICLRNYSARS